MTRYFTIRAELHGNSVQVEERSEINGGTVHDMGHMVGALLGAAHRIRSDLGTELKETMGQVAYDAFEKAVANGFSGPIDLQESRTELRHRQPRQP